MKKSFLLLLLLCFSGALILIAQSDKKVPPPPPPKEVKREVKKVEMVKFSPPILKAEEKKGDEFYNRNPSVKEVYRQGDFFIIKLKDGKIEKYNGKNDTEMKKFVDKYGESPIPPPPPPKVDLSNFNPPPKPVKS